MTAKQIFIGLLPCTIYNSMCLGTMNKIVSILLELPTWANRHKGSKSGGDMGCEKKTSGSGIRGLDRAVMICNVWFNKCLVKGHLNRERGKGSQGATFLDF